LIEDVDRFAIGVDRGDGGAFAPVLDLCDLKARQCPMGSTLSQCGNQTHVLSEVINLPVCTQPRTSGDGGKAPPTEGPSTSPGEGRVDAGSPPAPGAPPRPGEHDAGASPAHDPTPPHDSSGCSVSSAGEPGDTSGLFGVVGALALLLGRCGGRIRPCDGVGKTRRVRRF
jgi:MYXO-CTERM domain-containing protein